MVNFLKIILLKKGGVELLEAWKQGWTSATDEWEEIVYQF
jgi:hypothetical protein